MGKTVSRKNNKNLENNYINREQSWLAFNERILATAQNTDFPLLERLRFLSIAANNLDEFYMVRLASLLRMQQGHGHELSIDGCTPAQQIPDLIQRGTKQIGEMMRQWRQLRRELRKQHIHVISPKELSAEDHVWLEDYFLHNIFPVLTPMAIDALHPVPLIPCQGTSIVVQLQSAHSSTPLNAFIPLPIQLSRFVPIPGQESRYIVLDHVILLFLKHIFSNYKIIAEGIFRIIRDSEMEPDEDGIDVVVDYERALKQRLHGEVIQLAVNAKMPEHLRLYVAEQFRVNPNDMLVVDGILGINDIVQIIDKKRDDLLFPPFTSRIPQRIKNLNNDLFEAISLKDILIHHPYESFGVVINFIKQAALDPNVVTIKQTLYRTGSSSQIVNALIDAAQKGKSVTVLVEIKARFDEETNIRWAKSLEDAGVHVIYGVAGLKTHAKITLVTRKECGQIKSYVHFGTGNYNAATAQVYADLSLLTANPVICHEAAYLFNYLTGYTRIDNLQHLLVAPFTLRYSIINMIQHEIENAKAGKPARIWAKMNSLTDPEIIDAFYEASKAGVKIDFIIRGICSLRPGIPGISENITVKSIVGRFLEHARIFCFANGAEMSPDQAVVYMSSADMMLRNLDWRLEVMVPILNTTVKKQILEQIIQANLSDQANSWYLDSSGSYTLAPKQSHSFNAHDFFLKKQSLSGSGIGPYAITPQIIRLQEE